MSKWYRCNPHLGCRYEITEAQALRKINSKWWVPVWDEYWQTFSKHSWYNVRDPERDWIFRVDEDGKDDIKTNE